MLLNKQAIPSVYNLDVYFGLVTKVFSWVVLAPIAVIVSGKFISRPIKLSAKSTQWFKIHLPGVLKVQATDNEVILGFTSLIITLLVSSVLGGPELYTFVRDRFGLDPGQFTSLCIFSSFLSVLWTFGVYLFATYLVGGDGFGSDFRRKHDRLIRELSRREEDGDD